MALQSTNIRLKKLLLHIEYNTRLSWFSKAGAALQRWLDEDERRLFPRWAADFRTEGEIRLINQDDFHFLVCRPKGTAACAENVPDDAVDDRAKRAQRMIAHVIAGLDLRDLTCVGVECGFLVPYDGDFETLANFLDDQLTRRRDFEEWLPHNCRDMAVIWDFLDSRIHWKWTLGPLRSDEHSRHFGQWGTTPPREFVPAVSLYGKIEARMLDDLERPRDSELARMVETELDRLTDETRRRFAEFAEALATRRT